MQRIAPALLSIVATLMTLVSASQGPAQAQSPKPVLAFYYVWYDHTTWKKSPDVPAVQYTSKDPQASARHIDWARSTGIDGFVVSWFGPGEPELNQTQPNLEILLNLAAERNFKVAIDFETQSPYMKTRKKLIDGLKYAVGTLANHPAYYRFNGKPVIFFWRNDAISPGEWASIRKQVDPGNTTLWISEGVSTSWLPVFDGLHLYNVAWAQDFGAVANRFGTATKQQNKIWVGTAMPGWDDTRVTGRAGRFKKDRAGGAFYRNSFTAAAASNPDIMVITSFNEWMEGSHMEPSTTFGDAYLHLTRELIALHRANLLVPPTPTATPTATPIPTATPRPTATPQPSPTPQPSATPTATDG